MRINIEGYYNPGESRLRTVSIRGNIPSNMVLCGTWRRGFRCVLCNASGSWMQIWDHHTSQHHKHACAQLPRTLSFVHMTLTREGICFFWKPFSSYLPWCVGFDLKSAILEDTWSTHPQRVAQRAPPSLPGVPNPAKQGVRPSIPRAGPTPGTMSPALVSLPTIKPSQHQSLYKQIIALTDICIYIYIETHIHKGRACLHQASLAWQGEGLYSHFAWQDLSKASNHLAVLIFVLGFR